MKGLLLAGGRGTRLRPLTFTGNKHMIPIANKPMILYGVEQLRKAGIQQIGVILGPIKEGVVETLGDGSRFGVKLTYIDQPDPRGLAHAVAVAQNYLGDEPFVMYLGDNLLKQDLKQFINLFKKERMDCVIGSTEVEDPSRYGVVVFAKDGSIERFVEKPKDAISRWALIGVYVFNSKIFQAVNKIKPSWRNELEITDAIQTLLKDGAKIGVQKVKGWWKDTGRPEDILEANQLVLQDLEPGNNGKLEEDATVSANTAIGKRTIIHPHTLVRGPSIIGEDCEIGPNTYVGPYTSIGNNVTIRNTEVENSIIMDGAEIDCGKRITDSLVGRGVTIKSIEQNIPKGHRLILGDMAHVTI
jgi:glucose-1-phosphate thymidylyltransferase